MTLASTERAKRFVAVVFLASGTAFATWASRIPQVRDNLDLSPAALGIVLLGIAAGSMLALPTAGIVVHRLGASRTVAVMSLVFCVGLGVAAVGAFAGVVPLVIGLVLMGYGNGNWDVAMNVEAAEVERKLDRSIMSRFHAGFSVGAVIGAVIGAGMNAVGVSPTIHFALVAVVIAVAVPWAAAQFLPAGEEDDGAEGSRARDALRAWTEPRTLVIGLLVLAMAFAEGTGNDWLGIAAIDGYGTSAAVGSLALAVFVGAMTAGRWFGPQVLDRFGRVVVLRVTSAIGAVGVVLVVLGTSLPLAFAGIALWGLGCSLGFPVGMSAAADEPERAAARVSVVATIGYTAFLAGPTLIGLAGEQIGVLRALALTAALLAFGAIAAGATRPLVRT